MYRSGWGFVLLLVSPLISAGGQDLDRSTLEKLKAATVFVTVDSAFGRGSGSGFLFLKRDSAAYVITCEHVVGNTPTVGVVFHSGTASENVLQGKVIAADPSRDIACVVLKGAKGLPAPLELGEKTTVTETETVYVAGFPFGWMLAAREKNPEVSVSKSSVSSVRRDADNRVVSVQMSSEVNPGNSGGPVVNAKGKVVGVTRSKVAGTGTAFAVPPEEVQKFLHGRVRSSSFKPLSSSAAAAKFEVTVELIDPLGTLRNVGLAWYPERALAAPPEPGKDGTWGKVHPAAKTMSLKIDEDAATGTLEVGRASSDPAQMTLLIQVLWVGGDGKTHYTEPAPLEVEFSGASEDPKGAPPPAAKAVDIPVGDEVRALGSLRLRAAIGDLILSPDGGSLYALDLSEGKVYQIKPDTLEISAQVETVENAVAMCLTPDGRTIYVGGRDPGLQKVNGCVQAISTGGMKTVSTFTVPFGIHRLVATNSGTIAATGVGQWSDLAVIQASTKNLIGRAMGIYGGSALRLHPDQSRVYTGDWGLSPGNYHCVSLRKSPSGQYETYRSRYHGDYPLGGDFEITPDGRFLVGCFGSVLRLGRVKDADLLYASKIDRAVSIGLARGSNTFLLSTAEGFLKVYDLQNFEMKKSVKVGLLLTHLALDPSRARLFAVASPLPSQERGFYAPQEAAAGDIVSLSLKPGK